MPLTYPEITVQDESTTLTRRPFLNFTGAGVAATDDAGNSQTDVTISGGGGGSASATTLDVNQTAHGLAVADVVRHNGTAYVEAVASSASTAEAVGIVSAVAGANDFTLLSEGRITGLSGLTAGTVYFLSPTTAGLLTSTEPTTVGHVSKPLLIATSTTGGWFFNFRGMVVSDSNDPAPQYAADLYLSSFLI